MAKSSAKRKGRTAPARWVFGPEFFAQTLGALARTECAAGDARPEVILHLADGMSISVCHLVGLAPAWVAIEAHEDARADGARTTRTEIVPYEGIVRVTLRAMGSEDARIGFDANRAPTLIPPPEGPPAEAMLAAMARSPRRGRRSTRRAP
jgi:hypothetical protein